MRIYSALMVGAVLALTGCAQEPEAAPTVYVQKGPEVVRNYAPAVAAVPVIAPLVDDYTTAEGIIAIAHRVLGSIGETDVQVTSNDPAIGDHLAGVWPGDTGLIMLNTDRLIDESWKVESVVLHEAMHIRQNRLGMSNSEQVADCAAIALGATWTWYTDSCDAYQDDVAALIK